MKKFEIGKTYKTRSICDHSCIITVKVLKRTAKTIVALVDDREEKRLRIKEYENEELVNPWGVYSMSPIVRAS
jgi:hypothetical protein